MFKILLILSAGAANGFVFRRVKFLQYVEKTIVWTVRVMLFVFGLTIGSNRELIANIGNYGVQALVIALLGIAGSLVASFLFYKWLNGRKEEEL